MRVRNMGDCQAPSASSAIATKPNSTLRTRIHAVRPCHSSTSMPAAAQARPPREPVWMRAIPIIAATGHASRRGRRFSAVMSPADRIIALRLGF